MLFKISGVGRISGMKELNTFETKDGKESCVLNFSVAVSKSVKKKGEWVDEPHYYNCTAWGSTAKYIEKSRNIGDQVTISGNLEHETWDNENGKGQRHNIIVTDVELGRTKGDGIKAGSGGPTENPADGDDGVTDEGTPFA